MIDHPSEAIFIAIRFARELNKADNALLKAKRSGKDRIYLVGKSENNISDIE